MTIPSTALLTSSLKEKPWGEKVTRIMAAALAAVDPTLVIQNNLSREGNQIRTAGGMIDLASYREIHLLSIGKAALPMARGLIDLLGNQLTAGYILTKQIFRQRPAGMDQRMKLYAGSHPIPDQDGLQATADILAQLSSREEDDLVITLISGGASALFTNPAQGISLPDLQQTNQILLSCGADIHEINTIRKHLSQVKGGGLARVLHPATIYTLILSDVSDDQIDIIGSGPTAPDPTTFADALKVVEKYQLQDSLPGAVSQRLDQGRQGMIPETPKPAERYFSKVVNLILANNQQAVQGGAEQARWEGFHTTTLPQFLTGAASEVGEGLARRLSQMALNNQPFPCPSCLIAGGETTVDLTNTKQPGEGGRNLETALSALPGLDGLDNVALITLATDGEDGPTDAAGAVVTGESYQRCQQLGLNPEEYLLKHDSYSLFAYLDDLLLPGPTGTNVNDLYFLFTN